MSHIPYTVCRSGTYYYNRRVPKHAVSAYGSFIRQRLSHCPEEAAEYAKRLGYVLEASWIWGELEEAMRRAFHSRFRSDIPVSSEIINWIEPDDTPPTEISVDYILKKYTNMGNGQREMTTS